MKKLIVSFSGGKTSAFMLNYLYANCRSEFEMVTVFANTGKENEETLNFVKKCGEYFNIPIVWVEAIVDPVFGNGVRARVVGFDSASRNGEPFEAVNKKYGLSSIAAPQCSNLLKRYVINNYARQLGWKKYYTAIGLRADEIDRINKDRKKLRLIYPLISFLPTIKYQVNRFWDKMPFNLNLKEWQGNCDFCYKKSISKLCQIARESPDRLKWWEEQEKKYENYLPESRKKQINNLPIRMFRKNLTVNDIRLMSKRPVDLFYDLKDSDCKESCEI